MTEKRWPFVPHDREILAEQVAEFTLPPVAMRELELAIAHAREDLLHFLAKRTDRTARARQRRRRQRLSQLISKVIGELERDPADLADALPLDVCEAIARSTSPWLIEKATGLQLHEGGIPVDYRVTSAALRQSPTVLLAYLREVDESLAPWIGEASVDRGGAEVDPVRQHLILVLAGLWEKLFGDSATPTSNGGFQRLVAAVVFACGLDDIGIEKMVERTLAQLKRSREKPCQEEQGEEVTR